MYILSLQKIHCTNHSSGAGNDDVYVKIIADGNSTKIPDAPSVKHSWDIDPGDEIALQPSSSLQDGTTVAGSALTIVFSSTCSVELWDYDSGSSDDKLGSFKVDTSKESDTVTVTGDGATYKVGYKLLTM